MSVPRFATVSLDADSTLSAIEGIDWLAALRGDAMAARSAALTQQAMDGTLAIEAVYGARLDMVRPTPREIEGLAKAYVDNADLSARSIVADLQQAGVRVLIVSGGVQQALLPLARVVGIPENDVHAVALEFSADTSYKGFTPSPLATQNGKATVLHELSEVVSRPLLHVGDGVTDLEARAAADAFAAFTGFVRREHVVARADYVVNSFAELRQLVLGR